MPRRTNNASNLLTAPPGVGISDGLGVWCPSIPVSEIQVGDHVRAIVLCQKQRSWLNSPNRQARSRIHGHISINAAGGRVASKTYRCWTNMISRCENKKVKAYPRYGGRGITVCRRWRNSFVAFLADMGESPAGMTIERKNNELGYKPSNCIWATYSDQNKNRRAFTNHRFRVVTVFMRHNSS